MVHDHCTTTAASSTVTLLALDRLRAELHRRAADARATTIHAGHRALAQAIGCSASRIPTLMRRLEASGEIARSPFKNSYTLRVIDQGGEDTTSAAAPLIDHERGTDRSGETPDRSQEAAVIDQGTGGTRSGAAPLIDHSPSNAPPAHSDALDTLSTQNRVGSGCMEDPDSHDQQHQQAAVRARDSLTAHPLYQALTQAGANATVASAIMKRCPERTPAELESALALALERCERGRAVDPRALVFGIWRRGERLHEELTDGAHRPGLSRDDPGDRGTQRPERGPGRDDRRPNARGRTGGAASSRGEKRDKYGVGAAYRERPSDEQLPPFLRAARERTRQAGAARA